VTVTKFVSPPSNLVTAFLNRAGQSIACGYDALGRLTSKDLPGTAPDYRAVSDSPTVKR
jgi:YD repeat-containing protein